MIQPSDRLYELLPVYTRQQDAIQGYLLRDLLRVIGEQVDVVEEDITQLYENWFIETCQDWVVPYLGDLVGYRVVHEAGEPGDVNTATSHLRNKILIPRREVANTIHYRRRKGTLALLEILANQVAGWPARAVEFYRLLGVSQALNHLQPGRGRTVDLRCGDALDRLDGPFDELAHTVDVRRINSIYAPGGRYNIPSVGLFVWRLRAYPVTEMPACSMQQAAEAGPHCFTFSLLGNDCPLFARPQPESEPTAIAGEENLPAPIRRRAFAADWERFYGEGKSIAIWKETEDANGQITRTFVTPERIIPANLDGWRYAPSGEKVAVDPELGRITFDPDFEPARVWVSYYYGFSADMGGGEYRRRIWPVEPAPDALRPIFYRVKAPQSIEERPISAALAAWEAIKGQRPHAVIELVDSAEYPELLTINLSAGESLQIRAANQKRPVVSVPEKSLQRAEFVRVGKKTTGGRLTLDGLTIASRSLRIDGNPEEVNIRHCTLVPGWELLSTSRKARRAGAGPSLQIYGQTRLTVEHSILGPIQVHQDEARRDPIAISISDSIVDATDVEAEALAGVLRSHKEHTLAHAVLTIERSTVIGQVRTHAIELAENTIFVGAVVVARRQMGCMRFCYVPPEGCLTPRRFNCQPELAEQAIQEEIEAARFARQRVQPRFNSLQYGTPTYCQLAGDCAVEITRGADDEAEMGAFHDLFQPQRAANLRARLAEYTPAGADAGLMFAN